jgi:hypothetical protein
LPIESGDLALPYEVNGGESRAYIDEAHQDALLAQQINQLSSATSLNFKAKNNFTLKVQLS